MADDVNPQRTQELQSSEVYGRYKQWLVENGCKFPSIDFPVAFWNEGVPGVIARETLSPGSLVAAIPYSLTLSVSRAKTSEIAYIFEAHPEVFSRHTSASQLVLCTFLIYERLKGQDSFWEPHFSSIPEPELLHDWTAAELAELQDELLVLDSHKSKQRMEQAWNSLAPVCAEYNEVFGVASDLKTLFEWAWKVDSSRRFSWRGGMFVPLADNINHDTCTLRYLDRTQDELRQIAPVPFLLPKKQCLSRLDKLLLKNPQAVQHVPAIWEIDELLAGLRSDSDKESDREFEDSDVEAEVFDEDGDQDSEEESGEINQKYLVLLCSDTTGFDKGQQVFQSYDKLTNRDLLLEYGFALPNNKYDSYVFRLWRPASGLTGLVHPVQIATKSYRQSAAFGSLAEVSEKFTLKAGHLNTDVLTYFRKQVPPQTVTGFEHIPRLPVDSSPVYVGYELHILSCVLELYETLLGNFTTSFENDTALLRAFLSPRLKQAVVYRHSQKYILKCQLEYVATLKQLLQQVADGHSIAQHLIGKTADEVKALYPLRKYLSALKTSSYFTKLSL